LWHYLERYIIRQDNAYTEMVKLIGIMLIFSSLFALVAAGYIGIEYGSHSQISGNAVSNILSQKPVKMNSYDYIAGTAVSYSIVSFIVGIMFLSRI